MFRREEDSTADSTTPAGESSNLARTSSLPDHSTPVNRTISTVRQRDPNQSYSPSSPSRKRNKPEEGPTSNALHEPIKPLTNDQFESSHEFINVIAVFIGRYTSQDEWVPPSSSEKSAFYGISVPDMPLKAYVERIFVYAYCSPSAFVVALILMRRAANKHMELCWTVSNIHRLLLAGVIVATKIVDDRLFTMAHYSRVGGVPTTKETLRLELIFLKSINNEIGMSDGQFNDMMAELKTVRDELRGNTEQQPKVAETCTQNSGVTTEMYDVCMTSDEIGATVKPHDRVENQDMSVEKQDSNVKTAHGAHSSVTSSTRVDSSSMRTGKS